MRLVVGGGSQVRYQQGEHITPTRARKLKTGLETQAATEEKSSEARISQAKTSGKKTPAKPPSWLAAVHAAESKQAKDIRALDLRDVTGFTDYLILCSGTNSRQIQTLVDEIETQLQAEGERPLSVEGYSNAEWVLLDYGDLVVNVLSEKARAYYDLERLWRDAKPLKW